MFYAQFVLSKKGPLAKIWLAAHWEKKLSKAQIFETNVDEAVDEIMQPKQKMALRTTGHLLLGIVRIYSRKTKYLLADCNEAFLKIKLAFRPGQLDAPNEELPINSFSMRDVFGDFDSTLPEFNEADYVTTGISQSRVDDITLKEDTLTDVGMTDNYTVDYDLDDFGEHAAGIDYDDEFGDLANDVRMNIELELAREASNSDSLFGREREPTPCLDNAHAPGNVIFGDDDFGGADDGVDMEDHAMDDETDMVTDNTSDIISMRDRNGNAMEMDDTMSVRSFQSHATSLDRELLQAETESYYERQERRKKKRRLLVDEIKNLTGDEMKSNLADYSDTLNQLDLAPPTRKLMKLKMLSTAEKLFHYPGASAFKCKTLIRQYQTRLVITKNDKIDVKNYGVKYELGLGEIEEDEFNYPDLATQDTAFNDEFEEVANVDFDNFHPDSPVHIELQEERPPSPINPIESDESSPSEKKKKKEKVVLEEEEHEDDEDNRWSKRTQGVLNSIANKLNHSDEGEIAFTDLLTKGSTRKTAAQKFYTMLVLKKWQAIDLQQSEPYEEIYITGGPNIGQTSGP